MSWLRAAVLGANDGIVSTASLLLGIAAAHAAGSTLLVAGLAGLVAGAMSMAAGEYVSVSSQSDTEHADLKREAHELATEPKAELAELAGMYVQRGLAPELAKQVAIQLTAHDALGAHARDELGISEQLRARPLQAALASAMSFAVGAAIPVAAVALSPPPLVVPVVGATSLVLLGVLGWFAARIGGANPWRGTGRVLLWGTLAMAITMAVGALFGIKA